MNGWAEQELIYEAAFQYEWGYSSELEEAARECIVRLKAEAWNQGRLAEADYLDEYEDWCDNISDHMPEPPNNPYQEDA